jgi:hypothetical protein
VKRRSFGAYLRCVAGILLVGMLALASAEAIGDPRDSSAGNVRYDGRVAFVRLRYEMPWGGRRGEPPWAHDYPTADRHMMKILQELTLAEPHTEDSNVFALDDPELFKFPIAYMSEPGFWTLNDEEATGLRDYLLKGGFVIFDDFRAYHWENFQEQLRRVLPDNRLIELDPANPVFHAFFEIDPATFVPPYERQLKPYFYGVFEDNDPAKRLMVVANYNNDLGEYWEFSNTGWQPVDLSNESYKYGVNYFVYGLTH